MVASTCCCILWFMIAMTVSRLLRFPMICSSKLFVFSSKNLIFRSKNASISHTHQPRLYDTSTTPLTCIRQLALDKKASADVNRALLRRSQFSYSPQRIMRTTSHFLSSSTLLLTWNIHRLRQRHHDRVVCFAQLHQLQRPT